MLLQICTPTPKFRSNAPDPRLRPASPKILAQRDSGRFERSWRTADEAAESRRKLKLPIQTPGWQTRARTSPLRASSATVLAEGRKERQRKARRSRECRGNTGGNDGRGARWLYGNDARSGGIRRGR
ncbi:hypothetical protein SKAU_G00413920 [Synaphobranchus kaupii]|uniref:Uncharacterized protein n=1 Tax=Synaphobranchus kaupii TaxID=118154 RepID=A0A9Q1E700_SYNKA|nr:hypothetical protein SKAU_G00413920 [Synaphobranchus kaupii]